MCLSVLFLLAAVFAKRQQTLNKYWEIPSRFSSSLLQGFFGDSSSFASLQQAFVLNVLHEAPSANNPIASTILGTVLGQLAGTIGLVVPIILLTKISGNDLKSIFFDKSQNRWTLVFGIVGFLVLYLYTATGRARKFFPNAAVPLAHYIALTPAVIVLVLCNGLREGIMVQRSFLEQIRKIFWSVCLQPAVSLYICLVSCGGYVQQ